jgi:L-fuculokinase
LSLEPVKSSDVCTNTINGTKIGVGIHDSSSALVPYLKSVNEQFILLSTGTWCIAINPFNASPVSQNELKLDCLNFISFEGKPVKASRLFSGNEHERQVKHLSGHFNVELDYHKGVKFDRDLIWTLRKIHKQATPDTADLGTLKDCPFVERNLNSFKSFEEAYHQFILDLVAQQIASIKLILGASSPRKIFVDGGFARNVIFMELLAEAFFDKEVYASEMAQASALGAALVISEHWNDTQTLPDLRLKRYYNS